jgi:adenosylcobinamide-phosphate synthase
LLSPLLALLALLIERAIGYPDGLLRRIGHPVTWMGALIGWLDDTLNREDRPRKATGVAALAVLLAVTAAIALAIEWALRATLPNALAFAALAAIASSLLAQKSLEDHVARVADALEKGLPEGRAAVGRIVGRDAGALDEAGVARAAIESLAENYSDGIVAPAFWIAVGGLTGGAFYKAANTADSMIGHRTPRHAEFGWAAARFDDLINLPASRLSALTIVIAAGRNWRAAWTTVRRDARHHRSPNAGWPEAAFAGTLGFKLAGPRVYGGVPTSDGTMGDGRADLGPADIRRALQLYRVSCLVLWALLAVAAAILWALQA